MDKTPVNLPVVADLKKIETGLNSFEKKKTELEVLAKEAKGLTLPNLHDKEQYKKIVECRKKLKGARIPIQKEAKELRDIINPFIKQISEREKELIAITDTEEKRLAQLEDLYDQEQERIKKEKAEAEKKRIQERIDKLQQYGRAHDYLELMAMDDDNFNEILEMAKNDFEDEQKRIKEEQEEQERLKKEEEERLAKIKAEQEAERKRLKEAENKQREEREKFEKEKQEFAERQKAEQEKIDAEKQRALEEHSKARKQKLDARCDQLFALGLKFDGEHYKGYNCFVPTLDISTHNDEQWAKLIAEIKPAIEAGKQKELEDQKAHDEKIRKEAEEKAKTEIETEAKRKLEEDAKKAAADLKEQRRIESLKPDKEKLLKIANEMTQTFQPVMLESIGDVKAKEILKEAIEGIERISFNLVDKAKKLK